MSRGDDGGDEVREVRLACLFCKHEFISQA